MPEIYQFRVHKAEAEYDGENLIIKLWYPENPEFTNERIGANPEWGVRVLDDLITKGHAVLADKNNPVKPPSAGSLTLFSDGAFVSHRRDSGAPVHKNYFGTSSGFPQSRDAIYSKKGLVDLALKETAEETMLLTRDKTPRLIVTPALREYSIQTMRQLGFELDIHEISEEIEPGRDTLIVYDHNGDEIYRMKTSLDMMFDADTSLNIMEIRRLSIPSGVVKSIDCEGMIGKDGKFIYFKRESFIIDPALSELSFGHPLPEKSFRVYQTNLGSKEPEVYSMNPIEMLGPDNTPVTEPYLFFPENLLTICLDTIGTKGYKGQKLHYERMKDKTMLEHGSESGLIDPKYLVEQN